MHLVRESDTTRNAAGSTAHDRDNSPLQLHARSAGERALDRSPIDVVAILVSDDPTNAHVRALQQLLLYGRLDPCEIGPAIES